MTPSNAHTESGLATELEKLSLASERKESKQILVDEFSSLCACNRVITLLTCPENAVVEIIAFREIKSSYDPTFVILDSNRNLYYVNAYLKKCIERTKNLIGILFHERSGIYFADVIGDIIFTFKRRGSYITKSKRKVATITDFKGVSFFDAESITEDGLEKYEEIPEGIKPKHLMALETLDCDTTYALNSISKYMFLGKQKYMLKIGNDYYKSNHWLEQELRTFNNEGKTTYEILVETGVKSKFQTFNKDVTPMRKKEMRCSCV